MTIYEKDPDVVRWGLHLIDVCSISNSGSVGTATHYDKDFSQLGYVTEGYCENVHANVENDEIIAYALQEELSRLAVVESAGSSHSEENHEKVSVLGLDWLEPSRWNSNSECATHEGNGEDGDGSGMVTFCPMGDMLSNWEDQSVSPEIEDESPLDGEVGKRLNHLSSILHVPKTNGDIPSLDEAQSDHQRLMDRLEVYDLVELKVSGDGNCQFRSLSDQIYRHTEHHKFVRERVLKQLKSHPELYESYVPMAYDEYLKKMSKTGEWGDHVTLQAAADSFGVKIFVVTSFKDTCYIEILPQTQKSMRIICLSFWAEVHYNSIYPQGELPAEETSRRRRKWRWLG